jgi:hypothetical protein
VVKKEPKMDTILKALIKLTSISAVLLFGYFREFRSRLSKFYPRYLRLTSETQRLDDLLDDESVELEKRLAHFRKEVFRILEEEKIPKNIYPTIRGFAEGVCSDFEALHKGKISGAMDILKKKADNATKLVLLTVVVKVFPEVSMESKRLSLMVKIAIFSSRYLGFGDDLMDVFEDRETPHLNSVLTAVGYGRQARSKTN